MKNTFYIFFEILFLLQILIPKIIKIYNPIRAENEVYTPKREHSINEKSNNFDIKKNIGLKKYLTII